MMPEKKNIVILDNREKQEKINDACSSCDNTGSCCSGFGIKAGSDKKEVFRILFLYIGMALIIFIVAYMFMNLVARIS